MTTIVEQSIEYRMSKAYQEQIGDLVAKQDRYIKIGPRKIGLEIEYPVIQEGGITCTEEQRDKLLNPNLGLVPELGAAQIELNTSPYLLTAEGIGGLYQEVVSRENHLRLAAQSLTLQILRSGTNPWQKIGNILRTRKPKYKIVPDYYNQARTLVDTRLGIRECVDVGDLSIVSLLNSTQVNLEARSSTDAIDLLNRACMLSPLMTAVSGNARYLEGRDTGMSDIRTLAWEMAVDTRTDQERRENKPVRVGLPQRYSHDLSDYLTRVGQYPFILDAEEAALQIGIGMYWRDARVKVIGESLVVELRPMSTQSTLTEDLAMTLFYVGRLHWSQVNNETLTPMDIVRRNKSHAMFYGLDAQLLSTNRGSDYLYTPRDILPEEIDKARESLKDLALASWQIDLLKLIEDRVEIGTPSDRMHSLITQMEREGETREEAIRKSLVYIQH